MDKNALQTTTWESVPTPEWIGMFLSSAFREFSYKAESPEMGNTSRSLSDQLIAAFTSRAHFAARHPQTVFIDREVEIRNAFQNATDACS